MRSLISKTALCESQRFAKLESATIWVTRGYTINDREAFPTERSNPGKVQPNSCAHTTQKMNERSAHPQSSRLRETMRNTTYIYMHTHTHTHTVVPFITLYMLKYIQYIIYGKVISGGMEIASYLNVRDLNYSTFHTEIEVKARRCSKAVDDLQAAHEPHLVMWLERPHIATPVQQFPCSRYKPLGCAQLLTNYLF